MLAVLFGHGLGAPHAHGAARDHEHAYQREHKHSRGYGQGQAQGLDALFDHALHEPGPCFTTNAHRPAC